MTQKTKTGTEPPDKYDYRGKLRQLQIYGNSYGGRKYQSLQATPLNNYQNFLLNRALFGLAVYSQEEITEMHWDKRKRIIKVHKRAQEVLNLWKQEIIVKLSNQIFTTFFPRMEITKELTGDDSPTDPGYKNKMSFKSLGISRTQVVSKLMEKGILPTNFMSLEPKELNPLDSKAMNRAMVTTVRTKLAC